MSNFLLFNRKQDPFLSKELLGPEPLITTKWITLKEESQLYLIR